MIIERIWVDNALRNYNYLIACAETGDALAIDPLDHGQCLGIARRRGWRITQVVNTHEHYDHIGGNRQVVAATGARLLAHHRAAGSIPGIDQGLRAGDRVRIGNSVELEVLDTPGHTLSHICLLSRTGGRGGQPALFCGDTLFNAGAGNCHNGGDPRQLYRTFSEQLAELDDETQVYPGHDYMKNNLGFALDREPDNATAEKLLEQVEQQHPADPLVTTIGLEKQINVFFRLRQSSVIAALRERFPELPEHPDAETVFVRLRELRNHW
ncbi:MAG: hydroxyacylglutathione hydrolase [Pseudomonadota bacterium]|nr:hydroxyacylglutathione hydrolase [Pseudomonadota bacterium]